MTLPCLPSGFQDMIHFAEICPHHKARDRCSRARRAGRWHRSPDSLARLHLNISGDAATWHKHPQTWLKIIWVPQTIGVPPHHPFIDCFSIINQAFGGTPIFRNLHMFRNFPKPWHKTSDSNQRWPRQLRAKRLPSLGINYVGPQRPQKAKSNQKYLTHYETSRCWRLKLERRSRHSWLRRPRWVFLVEVPHNLGKDAPIQCKKQG